MEIHLKNVASAALFYFKSKCDAVSYRYGPQTADHSPQSVFEDKPLIFNRLQKIIIGKRQCKTV